MDNELVLTKVFSIKPDKDSAESKQWTLQLTVPADATREDLAKAVLASEVIKVQNGNRSKYDKFPKGHVFRKTFSRPGVAQMSAQEQFKADLVAEGIDPKDKKAVLDFYEVWITR